MKVWVQEMKQAIIVLLVAAVRALPCTAGTAVQAAAKTALANVNGGTLSKLYRVRSQADTPERREKVIQACTAGLFAIGDFKNAAQVKKGLADDMFMEEFTVACAKCGGEGTVGRDCYKCKGTGQCQNNKCNVGRVIEEGFNGARREKNCPVCGGAARCKSCKGDGKVQVLCKSCNGAKKAVNKEKALTVCKDLLRELTVSEKEEKRRRQAEEEARLAQEKKERAAREKEAAERATRAETERKRRMEEAEERAARARAERARREKEEAEERDRRRAEEERDAARRQAEQEEHEKARLEEVRRETEKLRESLSVLPKSAAGWERRTNDHGEFAERIILQESYNPMRIRVFANGSCMWAQKRNDGKDTVFCFASAVASGDARDRRTDKRIAYKAYMAIFDAAKKAREWKEIAVKRNEETLEKEIPVVGPLCLSATRTENGKVVKSEVEKVKFFFVVRKRDAAEVRAARDRNVGDWFKSLGRDISHQYSLLISSGKETMIIDLDSSVVFLMEANPVGAFEALEQYAETYK